MLHIGTTDPGYVTLYERLWRAVSAYLKQGWGGSRRTGAAMSSLKGAGR